MLRLTLGLSFGVHVAIAAALFAARHASSGGEVDPSPQLAGETFELPAPETAENLPLANASPSPAALGAAAPVDGDGPAHPRAPAAAHAGRTSQAGRPSAGRAEPGQPDGNAGSTSQALYGATGDRSASDLATAFTRGFPQAASADPAWRSAALGAAGDVDVILTLDEAGHLEGTQIVGHPSPALANGVRRTLALIKGRPFVAKGKTTKLRVVATVSSDAVHDGLHGDVFAIGGSFGGGEGNAFFALAVGRRIDLRVSARR